MNYLTKAIKLSIAEAHHLEQNSQVDLVSAKHTAIKVQALTNLLLLASKLEECKKGKQQ